MASGPPVGASVYELPVPTYSAPGFRSSVGEDQMAAPAGPYNCVPAAFFRCGLGSSGMEYDFQINLPVNASSASTLPRNVQHSYLSFRPTASSMEETGT